MKNLIAGIGALVLFFICLGGIDALFAGNWDIPKVFRDGNWRQPGPGEWNYTDWKALDAQVKKYDAFKWEAKKAEENGELRTASILYLKSADNAIWSWTQGWQLNNAAFALAKLVDAEDGLTEYEEKDFREAESIYKECLEAVRLAELYGAYLLDEARKTGSEKTRARGKKMLKESIKCQATAAKSLEWIEKILARWVS